MTWLMSVPGIVKLFEKPLRFSELAVQVQVKRVLSLLERRVILVEVLSQIDFESGVVVSTGNGATAIL